MKSRKSEFDCERDGLDTFIVCMMGVCLVSLAVVVSVAWPMAYIVGLGMLAIAGVASLTFVLAMESFARGGLLGWLVGDSIIKTGFELVGLILRGLVSVGSND